MNEILSVGIVGCGYWGPNLARNFNLLQDAQVKAICDLDSRRLMHMQRLYPTASLFADYQEMLESVEIDAVVVATPIRSHHPLAKAALLTGKHVLVEKPLASSAAECQELIEIAAARNLILMVGHTFLFSEPVRRIKEIIDSGEIGEIRYINCQRLNLGIFQPDTNVAWDLAPHDISIILHMIGEMPMTVNCQGHSHINAGVEDVTNMSLIFGGGRFATIQSSWIEPRKVRQMTFVGTRKMIVYNDLEPLEKIRIHDVRVERPPHYDSYAEFHYSYHYGDCYVPRLAQFEPLGKMCSHFIACIRERAEPLTDGNSGLEMVRILEASSRSLCADGAPIQVHDGAAPKLQIGGPAGASLKPKLKVV